MLDHRVPPRFAIRAGLAAAVLIAAASLAGILFDATYAREAAAWRTQAIVQDWFDLVVAVPWLAIAALRTARGSRRGLLLLGGGFAYTAYTFAIYAFAVHFNALFLVYVAALGLSAWGLVDLGRSLAHERVATWFTGRAPTRLAGTALIACSIVFACLWLAQILPAIVGGGAPAELDDVGLVTNPIHVLDLAFALPLLLVAGRWLRQRRDLGYALGVILCGFAVLMDIAILAMAETRALAIGFAILAGFFALLLFALLAAIHERGARAMP